MITFLIKVCHNSFALLNIRNYSGIVIVPTLCIISPVETRCAKQKDYDPMYLSRKPCRSARQKLRGVSRTCNIVNVHLHIPIVGHGHHQLTTLKECYPFLKVIVRNILQPLVSVKVSNLYLVGHQISLRETFWSSQPFDASAVVYVHNRARYHSRLLGCKKLSYLFEPRRRSLQHCILVQ